MSSISFGEIKWVRVLFKRNAPASALGAEKSRCHVLYLTFNFISTQTCKVVLKFNCFIKNILNKGPIKWCFIPINIFYRRVLEGSRYLLNYLPPAQLKAKMKTAQQILIFVSGHDSAKSAKIKSNAPRSARGNGKCDIARSRTMSSRNHIPTQTSETYPTKLFSIVHNSIVPTCNQFHNLT